MAWIKWNRNEFKGSFGTRKDTCATRAERWKFTQIFIVLAACSDGFWEGLPKHARVLKSRMKLNVLLLLDIKPAVPKTEPQPNVRVENWEGSWTQVSKSNCRHDKRPVVRQLTRWSPWFWRDLRNWIYYHHIYKTILWFSVSPSPIHYKNVGISTSISSDGGKKDGTFVPRQIWNSYLSKKLWSHLVTVVDGGPGAAPCYTMAGGHLWRLLIKQRCANLGVAVSRLMLWFRHRNSR